MALLTAVSVLTTATTVTAAAAGTSNTISASDIGNKGCLINIINGSGGSINVTLEDPTTTAVGNAGTEVAQAVANSADRWFKVTPKHVDPATGVATVTLSSATSVTYKLLRMS
jgi:hypothetical protein